MHETDGDGLVLTVFGGQIVVINDPVNIPVDESYVISHFAYASAPVVEQEPDVFGHAVELLDPDPL